jgi:dihydroxyacetone kinase-like protein
MVDALLPAVEAAHGDSVAQVLAAAAAAAQDAVATTVPMVARKGRASYLGERSAGHADPGATSTAVILRALAEAAGG